MSSRMAKGLVAIVAGLGLVLGCVSLFAAPAQAGDYPALSCDISVSPNPVVGGHDVTVTGRANKSVDWTVMFGPRSAVEAAARARADGGMVQTATGHGRTFEHVFSTPKVSTRTPYVVKAQCGAKTLTAPVAVVPAKAGDGNDNGDGNGGGLPNTGGPSIWLGILGLALLAEGTRRIHRARRA